MPSILHSTIKKNLNRIFKMILVLGNSAKRIELRDLGDTVYYKQQKSFNDSDYARSNDLKREINAGRLIVLKNTKDNHS
jgi:hypothetical protein